MQRENSSKSARCKKIFYILPVLAICISLFYWQYLPITRRFSKQVKFHQWTKLKLSHSLQKLVTQQRKSGKCTLPVVALMLSELNTMKIIEKFHNSSKTKHIPIILVEHEISANFQNLNIDPDYAWLKILKFLTRRVDGEVIYINSEIQNYMFAQLSTIVNDSSIHYHPRSLGYLSALALGACRIWDYENGALPTNFDFFDAKNLNQSQALSALTIYSHRMMATNPLVLFGAMRENKSDQQPNYPVYPNGLSNMDIHTMEIPTMYDTFQLRKAAAINGSFQTGILQTFTQFSSNIFSNYTNVRVHFESRLDNANLHPTQFSPFCSQSSLYFYETFWSAYFPLTVPQHLSHVWQSYITQTLMRCTGFLLTFHKPVMEKKYSQADQVTKLKSSDSAQIDALIRTLYNFTCTSADLSKCLHELYTLLRQKNLIGEKDVTGIKAWIDTLTFWGYKFPPMKSNLCKSRPNSFQIQKPLHPQAAVANLPALNVSLQAVHINFFHLGVIPVWLSMYQYVAPRPVFYLPGLKPCSSMATKDVHCIGGDYGGYYSYQSTIHAIENYPQYDVYVASHDDSFYNPKMLQHSWNHKLTLTCTPENIRYLVGPNGTVNITGPNPRFGAWIWDGGIVASINKMFKSGELAKLTVAFAKFCPGQLKSYKRGAAYDTYVIHRKDIPVLLPILKIFLKNTLFLETAIPWALICGTGATLTTASTIDLSDLHYLAGARESDFRSISWKTNYCKGIVESFRNASALPVQATHHIKLSGGNSRMLRAVALRECITYHVKNVL